jgi:hypothetical protein
VSENMIMEDNSVGKDDVEYREWDKELDFVF